VAHALRVLGAEGTIFVPQGASPCKLRKIEEPGGRMETVPGDPVEADVLARVP